MKLRLLFLLCFAGLLVQASDLDSLKAIKARLNANKIAQNQLKNALVSTDTTLQNAYVLYYQKVVDQRQAFPVIVGNDTLWHLYVGAGPLSAKERAQRLEKRIAELIDANVYVPSAISLEQEDEQIRLVYDNEFTLAVVTADDALFTPLTQLELAEKWQKKLSEYISQQRAAASWSRWLVKTLLVLLVIGVFGLIIWGINKTYAWLSRKAADWQSRLLTRLRIGNYQLFDEGRASLATSWLLKIGRWLLILLSFYLVLPVVFSLFPFTEGLAKQLFGYVWSPFKAIVFSFLDFIPNLFSIAVIYLVTRTVVRFLQFLAREIDQGELVIPGFFNEWALPTYNIVRFLLYAFMLVVIFPYLPGSDSKVFQGVSVFLGILFSLGSSSAISNMVAGLVITYMRPFRLGDIIKIDDFQGEVIEKNLLVTRIRTPKNEEITIPNASVLAGKSVNYSVAATEKKLTLHTTVTIGYDVPWQQVHQMLITAAERSEGVLKTPAPFVLQTGLEDFYVSYQLNVYTDAAAEMPKIYSHLHANIQDVFNENGVEIMSPHYRAARDGNSTTIPANYLPNDYKAPSFALKIDKKETD